MSGTADRRPLDAVRTASSASETESCGPSSASGGLSVAVDVCPEEEAMDSDTEVARSAHADIRKYVRGGEVKNPKSVLSKVETVLVECATVWELVALLDECTGRMAQTPAEMVAELEVRVADKDVSLDALKSTAAKALTNACTAAAEQAAKRVKCFEYAEEVLGLFCCSYVVAKARTDADVADVQAVYDDHTDDTTTHTDGVYWMERYYSCLAALPSHLTSPGVSNVLISAQNALADEKAIGNGAVDLSALLATLRQLVEWMLLRPYQVSSADGVLHVQTVAGTLSGAVDALPRDWEQHYTGVSFDARNVLYADCDVTAHGKNISFVAPKLELHMDRPAVICTRAAEWPSSELTFAAAAACGANGSDACVGRDGADGANGVYGGAGGNVTFLCGCFADDDFEVDAGGGKGGSGQAGGTGGDGGSGTDSKDATSTLDVGGFCSERSGTQLNIADDPVAGGDGGEGGSGGAVGKGGSGGTVERVHVGDEVLNDTSEAPAGEDGQVGAAGSGGKGGRNGKPGKDIGARIEGASVRKSFFAGIFAKGFRDSRAPKEVRGMLRHPETQERHTHFHESNRKLIVDKHANDPYFTRTTHAAVGKKKQAKQNAALRAKSSCISKQACCAAMCAMAEALCQLPDADKSEDFVVKLCSAVQAAPHVKQARRQRLSERLTAEAAAVKAAGKAAVLWEDRLCSLALRRHVAGWLPPNKQAMVVHLLEVARMQLGTRRHDDFMQFVTHLERRAAEVEVPGDAHAALDGLLGELYRGNLEYDVAEAIVCSEACSEWQRLTETAIDSRLAKSEQLGHTEVMTCIREQVEAGNCTVPMETVDAVASVVSYVCTHLQDDTTGSVEECVAAMDAVCAEMDPCCDLEAREAWYVAHQARAMLAMGHLFRALYGKTLYAAQVVAIALATRGYDGCGVVLQISTGEGKTYVLGISAALKAKVGKCVDVMSSNADLAREGVKENTKLFDALRLTAASNCSDDPDADLSALRSHIVYGTPSSFGTALLEYERSGEGAPYVARYLDTTSGEGGKVHLFVDEADSVLLDQVQQMLYMAHPSPSLQLLDSLKLLIWGAVSYALKADSDSNDDIGSVLAEITEGFRARVREGTVAVPASLVDFCDTKMSVWVQSAHQAALMEEEDMFTLKEEAAPGERPQVVSVDKATGAVQQNVKYSNGLAEFLELKYGRELTPETLRAVFVSYKRLVRQHYGTNVSGVSGTLGGRAPRSFLRMTFGLVCADIPRAHHWRFRMHPSIVAVGAEEWRRAVSAAVSARMGEQPILILCENIRCAEQFVEDLERRGDCRVHRYFRNRHTMPGKLAAGDVVVASNKGGRGTDLLLAEAAALGLHVVSSFFADNTRVDTQGWGRAGRAGKRGSGQRVVCVDADKHRTTLEAFGDESCAAEAIVAQELVWMEECAEQQVQRLLQEDVPRLDAEEGLYARYRTLHTTLCTALRTTRLCKRVRAACEVMLADRWAFWLEAAREELCVAFTETEALALGARFDKEVAGVVLAALESDTHDGAKVVEALVSGPEHCDLLGEAFYAERAHTIAKGWFERAVCEGEATGKAALMVALCLVKENPSVNRGNVAAVRRALKDAQLQLDANRRRVMVNVESAKLLAPNENSDYERQCQSQLEVWGLHINTISVLLGGEVVCDSFKRESPNNAKGITEAQSSDFYARLTDAGVLYKDRVRRVFCNDARTQELERALCALDPTTRKAVITLVCSRAAIKDAAAGRITEADLRKVVLSAEELWAHLGCAFAEDVACYVVDPASLEAAGEEWAAFATAVKAVGKAALHDALWIEADWDTKVAVDKSLIDKAVQKGWLQRTRRATPRSDARSILQTAPLGRFGEELRPSLCAVCSEEAVFQTQLPYASREDNAARVHTLLAERCILKTGSLATATKYGSESDALTARVKDVLGDATEEQQTHVAGVLAGLKGSLRTCERNMEVTRVPFMQMKDRAEEAPVALPAFAPWHLDQFLQLEEEPEVTSWFDLRAFAVAMIGLAQIIGGLLLIAFTAGAASQIGKAFMMEGVKDMVYATSAGIKGSFSWKDWGIQKAISLALAIATFGMSALASCVEKAAIAYAASRNADACRQARHHRVCVRR